MAPSRSSSCSRAWRITSVLLTFRSATSRSASLSTSGSLTNRAMAYPYMIYKYTIRISHKNILLSARLQRLGRRHRLPRSLPAFDPVGIPIDLLVTEGHGAFGGVPAEPAFGMAVEHHCVRLAAVGEPLQRGAVEIFSLGRQIALAGFLQPDAAGDVAVRRRHPYRAGGKLGRRRRRGRDVDQHRPFPSDQLRQQRRVNHRRAGNGIGGVAL